MGFKIEVLKQGDGTTFPKAGQKVTVHYVGTLTNGQKFDSSRDRMRPYSFTIGKGDVIRGWDEGILKMSKGTRAKLECTADYAYGDKEFPPVIPAHSDMIFDIEILNIE